MSQPLVSLITPTYNRRLFMPQAIRNFMSQIYPKNKMEWIILDDGEDKILDLVKDIPEVRYYSFDTKMKLGQKRNFLNKKAKGQIIIAFDDDDWYSKDYVSYMSKLLMSSPRLIAGSSEIYNYFVDLEQIVIFGPYGPNHSCNGMICYKKEYLKIHSYENEKKAQEEPGFTNRFTEPMVQVGNPSKYNLAISHTSNSFDRRMNLDEDNPTCTITKMKLRNIIRDKKTLQFYKSLKAKLYSSFDE